MRWILLLIAVILVGCAKKEEPSDCGVSGVLSMKDVPDGWAVTAVPVGHPQILIDPDGNCLVRKEKVEEFFNYHGSMRVKNDPDWELQPCDLHGGRFHKLVNTKKETKDGR